MSACTRAVMQRGKCCEPGCNESATATPVDECDVIHARCATHATEAFV